MRRAAAAFGILLAASPAYAQNAAERGEQVRQIERQLEQERSRASTLERRAATEQSELEKLQEAARRAAATAMAREDEASNLELRLAEIDAERGMREAAIANRRGEIAALAGALQRLARQPARNWKRPLPHAHAQSHALPTSAAIPPPASQGWAANRPNCWAGSSQPPQFRRKMRAPMRAAPPFPPPTCRPCPPIAGPCAAGSSRIGAKRSRAARYPGASRSNRARRPASWPRPTEQWPLPGLFAATGKS